MYAATPQHSYLQSELSFQEQRVLNADPLELVCLLFEGAIQAVNDAQAFLNRGEIVARGRAIARAQAIVLELASSLDPAKGGSSSEELVGRLRLLYDYLLSKLATAHASQDANALEEAQALLEDLHNGWRLIRPQSQTGSIDQLPEPQPVDLCA